jgi:hypothetical protein
VGSTPYLLYIILCVVFEPRVINLCDRDIATAQLHIHHKPIGLLNVNGFYENLLSFLDHAVEQNFLTSSAR